MRGLGDEDWGRPTDCSRWDVRSIVAHVLGWAETLSIAAMVRLQRRGGPVAKEIAGAPLDGMNEVQVRQRAGIAPADLVVRLESAAPRAVAARAKLPGLESHRVDTLEFCRLVSGRASGPGLLATQVVF